MVEEEDDSLNNLNRFEDIKPDLFFGSERLGILSTLILAFMFTLLWIVLSSLLVGRRWYRNFFTTALFNPSLMTSILDTRFKLTPLNYQFRVLKKVVPQLNPVNDELCRRLVAGFDQYYKSLRWSRNLMALKLVDLRLLRFKKTFGNMAQIPLYSEYELKKAVKYTFREVRRLQVKAQRLQEQGERLSSEPINVSQLITKSTSSMDLITEEQVDEMQKQNDITLKKRTLLSSIVSSIR